MESRTSICVQIIDENIISYGDYILINKEDYIDAVVKYILQKKDYNSTLLETIKAKLPSNMSLKIQQQLFVCKIYIAWSVLTHLDNALWDIKIKYADSLLEKLYSNLFKEKKSFLGLSRKNLEFYFDFYKEGFSPRMSIQYLHMVKRYIYLLTYNYTERFIEFPNDEEYEFLKKHLCNWGYNMSQDLSNNIVLLLEYEICFIEEFMDYPIDLKGYYSKNTVEDDERINLSNPIKWHSLAVEVSEKLKQYFCKIICSPTDLTYFETDWDTLDNLKKRTSQALNSMIDIAQKYDLWLIKEKFPKISYVPLVEFFDSEGDLFIGILVRKEQKPFSLIHPLEKKRFKFIFTINVLISNKPDMHFYEKVKYMYGDNMWLMHKRKCDDYMY